MKFVEQALELIQRKLKAANFSEAAKNQARKEIRALQVYLRQGLRNGTIALTQAEQKALEKGGGGKLGHALIVGSVAAPFAIIVTGEEAYAEIYEGKRLGDLACDESKIDKALDVMSESHTYFEWSRRVIAMGSVETYGKGNGSAAEWLSFFTDFANPIPADDAILILQGMEFMAHLDTIWEFLGGKVGVSSLYVNPDGASVQQSWELMMLAIGLAAGESGPLPAIDDWDAWGDYFVPPEGVFKRLR